MRALKTFFLAAIPAVLLGGCATNLDVEAVDGIESSGSAFQQALHREYVALARMEYDESDWADTDTFLTRAAKAARGEAVGPEAIGARELPADKVGELGSAREHLVAALAAGAGAKPGPAARAQAMFDCWMQEQEENFQPDDIAECRADFEAAMKELAARPAAPAPLPGPWSLPFDFDSYAMNMKAMAFVGELTHAFMKYQPSKVVITGHADTAGGSAYNEALARKRTEAVARTLKAGGIPGGRLVTASSGETDPEVATADDVKKAENRRVEVRFVR